ncbi:MAG: hypothetical protein M1818_002811 [Claussenomyces sp. TS43310]|nr:MAG: hypothetical protein M1818_002811 [Claussenomyces sp. TS43310]
MAILLTGGTGKTSIRLARFLQEAKIPFLLASRKAETAAPSGMRATKFDWLNASTFEKPFQHAFPNGERIAALYLVAPEVSDPAPSMTAFIDHAATAHGVKRFVLLAGSSAELGGAGVGKVWQHLVDLGVEYCVLRPTWFMENLLEEQHVASIRDEGKIYTACGDGKIPFVSATDIAAVAFRALVDVSSHNAEYRVLGPALLTYDEIAAKLSSVLARHIVHVKCSGEERTRRLMNAGMPEHYASFYAWLEETAATGVEERSNHAVEQVTGRPRLTFEAWAQQNRTAWQ